MTGHRTIDDQSMWRFGWWMANGWLLFLLFPFLTVLFADLADWRKVGAIAVIVLFSLVHAAGWGYLLRRELGIDRRQAATGLRRWVDPQSSELWFGLLVLLTAAGLAVGGWPMFGVTPFIVSYAVFHFSWRTAGLVFATTLTAALVAPALGGVLGDIWFFSIILVSVGAGCALARVGEERQSERSTFQTRLAVGDERQRVARDVHDVLGHSLTAVILKGQVIERMLERIDPADEDQRVLIDQAREQLSELDTVSRRALAEIRSTVGGLRSADLGDELNAARAVLADAGVALTVSGDQSEVPDVMRPVLGWVVREAVTNVVRHARAANCDIELGDTGDDVLLRIRDDGVGIASSNAGNGLSGLRERVEAAGAELRVGEAGDTGTLVEVLG